MGRRGRTKKEPRETLRKQLLKIDVPFLVLTVMLLIIGLVMMFSASYARAFKDANNSTYYFNKQLLFCVLGFVGLTLMTLWDYHNLRVVAFPLLLFSYLLLILVLIIGKAGGGAVRWLKFGPVSVQPSEIAKLSLVLVFSMLISSYGDRMRNGDPNRKPGERFKGDFWYGCAPFAAILGSMAVLLIAEPHLSATVIVCVLGAFLMFTGGTRVRWILLLVALGIVLMIAAYFLFSHVRTRFEIWRNPEANQSSDAYQSIQALYAIGSGGLFGLGFGNGRQKYLYLPEERNDMIFAIVCEELGFVGAMFVLVLFALLIIRGFWIAVHARDRFGFFLASGFSALLALQVFFNVGVVTGLLPPTGISLPFFSYGGSALVVQLAEIGVILSVSKDCDNNLL